MNTLDPIELPISLGDEAKALGLFGQIVLFNFNYPAVTPLLISLHGWFVSKTVSIHSLYFLQLSNVISEITLRVARPDAVSHLMSKGHFAPGECPGYRIL